MRRRVKKPLRTSPVWTKGIAHQKIAKFLSGIGQQKQRMALTAQLFQPLSYIASFLDKVVHSFPKCLKESFFFLTHDEMRF
jgi:hypothetical protein